MISSGSTRPLPSLSITANAFLKTSASRLRCRTNLSRCAAAAPGSVGELRSGSLGVSAPPLPRALWLPLGGCGVNGLDWSARTRRVSTLAKRRRQVSHCRAENVVSPEPQPHARWRNRRRRWKAESHLHLRSWATLSSSLRDHAARFADQRLLLEDTCPRAGTSPSQKRPCPRARATDAPSECEVAVPSLHVHRVTSARLVLRPAPVCLHTGFPTYRVGASPSSGAAHMDTSARQAPPKHTCQTQTSSRRSRATGKRAARDPPYGSAKCVLWDGPSFRSFFCLA